MNRLCRLSVRRSIDWQRGVVSLDGEHFNTCSHLPELVYAKRLLRRLRRLKWGTLTRIKAKQMHTYHHITLIMWYVLLRMHIHTCTYQIVFSCLHSKTFQGNNHIEPTALYPDLVRETELYILVNRLTPLLCGALTTLPHRRCFTMACRVPCAVHF